MTLKQRFDRKWTPEPYSGCWLWIGSTAKGYGKLTIKHKDVLAHRCAWQLLNGEIPLGAHVLHSCDTPLCVNPDHLFIGSHTDNMRDMYAKRHDRWHRNAPRWVTFHKQAGKWQARVQRYIGLFVTEGEAIQAAEKQIQQLRNEGLWRY
jgi:hypothetical protein